jgi:hypothetical protein
VVHGLAEQAQYLVAMPRENKATKAGGPLGAERNCDESVVDRKIVLTEGGSPVQSILVVTSLVKSPWQLYSDRSTAGFHGCG